MLLQMRKQANISSFTTTEYLILDMYIWSQANHEPQIGTVGICAGNTEIRALFQHEENTWLRELKMIAVGLVLTGKHVSTMLAHVR